MDVSDTLALVRRAQSNDTTARDELFARYLPRVRAIVALRLGRRIVQLVESEDLVQESLLQALRGLGSFEQLSDSSFYDWISTIVANRIRDEWRRSHTRKRDAARVLSAGTVDAICLTSFLFPDTGPSPSELAVGREVGEQLETALLELDERHREAIVLREVCGMSYPEMAKRLELNVSSVRSLVTRAKARLAERLP